MTTLPATNRSNSSSNSKNLQFPPKAIYIPPGWWHSIRTFRPERDPHQNEKEELPFAFSYLEFQGRIWCIAEILKHTHKKYARLVEWILLVVRNKSWCWKMTSFWGKHFACEHFGLRFFWHWKRSVWKASGCLHIFQPELEPYGAWFWPFIHFSPNKRWNLGSKIQRIHWLQRLRWYTCCCGLVDWEIGLGKFLKKDSFFKDYWKGKLMRSRCLGVVILFACVSLCFKPFTRIH